MRFSGNYYFFDLQSVALRKYVLGPDYDVLGSTAHRLLLGKENRVCAELIGSAQGQMSIPAASEFEPFRLFPLTGNQDPDRSTLQTHHGPRSGPHLRLIRHRRTQR